MSQPAPTAKGSLTATPFAHLLIYALDHRLTGSIVFAEPNQAKHAITFVDGAPTRARAQGEVALLGELVRERGALGDSELDAAVTDARAEGRRLGELLVERSVIDAEALEELLREQVVRRLEFLATLPPATLYGYYEGTNFLERAGGPAGHPPPLGAVWRVIRVGVPPERVREHVGRLGDAPLRFHTDAPLARFGFGPRERAVVEVLRAKPQPYAELVGRGLAEPELVGLLVYAFSALRHLDTGSGARPVGSERASGSLRAPEGPRFASPPPPVAATSASPPAPTTAPSPPPAANDADPFRRELAERLGNAKQSYYELLGVSENAPGEAIASSFFQLAKRFHPDRLGPGLEDVRDQATRFFARMTEAHQVLSDAARRKEYDELLKGGGGAAEEQEEVLRVVRAATSFQKAQVLLKRSNFTAAETEARQALADDPSQADHVALVAWLEASKPNPNLDAVLSTLNDCVRMEEMNLRVRWYRGQILKRIGQDRRAVEDFRYIVERDPRHVDAQRELRLYDMQRGATKSASGGKTGPSSDSPRARRAMSNPPPSPEKPGFFGKLFKK
ncbi:MAG TPA: DnaJ domain-containing protein [Polyangiaceae bacterium]